MCNIYMSNISAIYVLNIYVQYMSNIRAICKQYICAIYVHYMCKFLLTLDNINNVKAYLRRRIFAYTSFVNSYIVHVVFLQLQVHSSE